MEGKQMKRKHRISSLVVMVLAVMLALAFCFITVAGAAYASAKNYTIHAENLDDQAYSELVERRSENIKYYKFADGTGEAVLFGRPVHYLENGEYKEIDNSLILMTDVDGKQKYRNAANSFAVYLSSTTGEGKISKGLHEISWSIAEFSRQSEGVLDSGLSKQQWSALSNTDKRKQVANLSSGLKYANAMTNADFQYYVVSNEVKQYLMLKSIDCITAWTETVQVTGLELVLSDNNTIKAVDKNTRKTVFTLPAPFMMDDNGDIESASEIV
jgi:hypothetical protein